MTGVTVRINGTGRTTSIDIPDGEHYIITFDKRGQVVGEVMRVTDDGWEPVEGEE